MKTLCGPWDTIGEKFQKYCKFTTKVRGALVHYEIDAREKCVIVSCIAFGLHFPLIGHSMRL